MKSGQNMPSCGGSCRRGTCGRVGAGVTTREVWQTCLLMWDGGLVGRLGGLVVVVSCKAEWCFAPRGVWQTRWLTTKRGLRRLTFSLVFRSF
jgi:hypothetical protein